MRAYAIWLEAVLLAAFLGLSVTNVSFNMMMITKPLSYTLEDKTAQKLNNANFGTETTYRGEDLLMSLVVIDEFAPYPRKIKIDNSPIINLDSAWVANKVMNVTKIYNSYIKGKEDWVLTSTFNYSGSEPYIEYTLRR